MTTNRLEYIVLLAFLIDLLLPPLAHAQPPCRYTVTYWPNMDCGFGPDPGFPVAVNVHGHVAGKWVSCGEPVTHTFIWSGGPTTTILPIPPGYRSMDPADMNDLGEIVGTLELPIGTGNPWRAFLRRANGQVIDLGLPPGGTAVRATSINNESEITGYYSTPSGYKVYVWHNGTFTSIELPPGSEWVANDIDDQGRLAIWQFGAQGFLWSDGRLTPLGFFPGGYSSLPRAIAPNGDVAGFATVPDPDAPWGYWARAFRFRSGHLFNLGVLPGFASSYGIAANDSVTVGYCSDTDPPGGFNTAFWFGNGFMRPLQQMQPNANLSLTSLSAINSVGQIAITGRLGTARVGVLLSPIAAPASDLNCDCRIGVSDLLSIIDAWGPCNAGDWCAADLNGDGRVNHLDLLLVIQHWGQQS